MFKKKLICLLIFFCILFAINGVAEEKGDEIHTINYLVQNSTESTKDMLDISIPLEKIEKSDFINIEDISPEFVESISPGEGQLFNITFTINQDKDVKPFDEIMVYLDHNPHQLVIPGKEKIIVSDGEAPKIATLSISPKCQMAGSISELRTRVFIHFKDGWSGINPESNIVPEGNFLVESMNYHVNKGDATLQFVFTPLFVGTYPIYLEGVEDLAGNSKPYLLGYYS